MQERELGEAGLERAIQRAEESKGMERLIAVGEALWWIGALDDLYEHTRGEHYYAVRRRSPEGETEGGLVYARNIVGHGLATVLGLVHVPVTWGGEPVMWGGKEPVMWPEERWRPFCDLPKPRRTERWAKNDWYRQRVGEQEILAPLRTARDFLFGL